MSLVLDRANDRSLEPDAAHGGVDGQRAGDKRRRVSNSRIARELTRHLGDDALEQRRLGTVSTLVVVRVIVERIIHHARVRPTHGLKHDGSRVRGRRVVFASGDSTQRGERARTRMLKCIERCSTKVRVRFASHVHLTPTREHRRLRVVSSAQQLRRQRRPLRRLTRGRAARARSRRFH